MPILKSVMSIFPRLPSHLLPSVHILLILPTFLPFLCLAHITICHFPSFQRSDDLGARHGACMKSVRLCIGASLPASVCCVVVSIRVLLHAVRVRLCDFRMDAPDD